MISVKLSLLLPVALVAMLAQSVGPLDASFDARDVRSPLRLTRTFELPNVAGRIDHMALDRASNHLFVAEYGNGSVDEIDLSSGKLAERIAGLRGPQGVAWLPRQGELAVASDDGSLRFYRRGNERPVAVIQFGDDADNVRLDGRNGNLVVGYGSGALAVVDASTHHVLRQLKLPAHPEAFQLIGSRVFVNVPGAHQLVIADLDQTRIINSIGTGLLGGNFPMAIDQSGSRIAVAYRFPSRLSVIDTKSGETSWAAPICGDADDLYFSAARILAVCGEGHVDLVADAGDHRVISIATRRGARTGLLADGDRLFVAVPARVEHAAVWEFSLPH